MSNINPNPFTTRPEIEGTFGVVTSTHWIATAVGMAMLEKGGNAFDAAVATAFTLQVVEPHLNGPGGDVPVIFYDARRGKPEVICGQGPAPAGATIAHYRGWASIWCPAPGCLPRCVPGTFETWMLLLRDYGTVSLPKFCRRHRLRTERLSAGRARQRHHRHRRAAVSRLIGRLRRRSICRMVRSRLPERCSPTAHLPQPISASSPKPNTPAENAIAQIERGAQIVVARLRRRSDRSFCRTQDVFDFDRNAASGRPHR